MTTIEYLYQNENCVVTGIHFTINDLVYLKKNKLEELTINYNKPTKEEMTEDEVILRLIDLYKLAKATNVTSGIFVTNDEYMENLDYVFGKLEKDFGVDLEVL